MEYILNKAMIMQLVFASQILYLQNLNISLLRVLFLFLKTEKNMKEHLFR